MVEYQLQNPSHFRDIPFSILKKLVFQTSWRPKKPTFKNQIKIFLSQKLEMQMWQHLVSKNYWSKPSSGISNVPRSIVVSEMWLFEHFEVVKIWPNSIVGNWAEKVQDPKFFWKNLWKNFFFWKPLRLDYKCLQTHF